METKHFFKTFFLSKQNRITKEWLSKKCLNEKLHVYKNCMDVKILHFYVPGGGCIHLEGSRIKTAKFSMGG